jgi:hypothetical protein
MKCVDDDEGLIVQVFYLPGERIKPVEVWEGPQRNLFRKYASKRTQSMKEIEDAAKQTVKNYH